MHNINQLELTKDIRERYPANWEICLQVSDFKIRLRTNQKSLKQELESYFNAFIAPDTTSTHCTIGVHQAPVQEFPFDFRISPPEPDKNKIKEDFFDLKDGRIVKKRTSGLHFIFGTRGHLAVGPCLENLNQVINFINTRFIEEKLNQGALLAHAAGVQLGNLGLAISGISGSGKTTLALKLLEQGFLFTSNDRLLVEMNNSKINMCGVAKMPRINPGTALNNPVLKRLLPFGEQSRLAQKTMGELWDLEQKYDVPLEKFYGSLKISLCGTLDSLLILNWSHTQQPLHLREFLPRERPELVQMFQKDPGVFYCPAPGRNPHTSLRDYLDLLEGIRLFELSGGIDFEEAQNFCLQILEQTETRNS